MIELIFRHGSSYGLFDDDIFAAVNTLDRYVSLSQPSLQELGVIGPSLIYTAWSKQDENEGRDFLSFEGAEQDEIVATAEKVHRVAGEPSRSTVPVFLCQVMDNSAFGQV